jgi:hypothetical protein
VGDDAKPLPATVSTVLADQETFGPQIAKPAHGEVCLRKRSTDCEVKAGCSLRSRESL